MEFFLYFLSGVLGAVLASFAVAQVWRLRATQLKDEKDSGEKIDLKEWKKLRPLTSVKKKDDRSHCLNCGYQLKFYDLVPIFSWLSLGGKCRKCRSKIGATEFIAEISMFALFTLLAFIFNPFVNFEINTLLAVRLLILFVALVPLLIAFIYDLKWSLLPTKIVWIFNGLAFVYWALGFVSSGISIQSFVNIVISMAIFPLVYFALAVFSKEQWVGAGDWILAVGLVFLLPNIPVFAMFLLFLSNIIGLIFAIGVSIFEFRKMKRGVQIPFGPAMIFATLILLTFQQFFMNLIILFV